MKIFKIVLLFICIISLLLPLTVFVISSHVQGYYKGFIDDPSKTNEEIREALARKKLWADICESYAWLSSYVVFGISALTLLALRRHKLKT